MNCGEDVEVPSGIRYETWSPVTVHAVDALHPEVWRLAHVGIRRDQLVVRMSHRCFAVSLNDPS